MAARQFTARIVYPFFERALGRNITSKVLQLKQDHTERFPERLRRRKHRLAALLGRAAIEVPYYRDLFKELNFRPEKLLKDTGYLNELPFLTKEVLVEQGNRLLSDRYVPAQLHKRRTGGSTGASTNVYYSTEALDWTAAINILVLEWAGKHRHLREAHLSSRLPVPFPLKDRMRERMKCLALNRANITTQAFDPSSLTALYRQLKRAKPLLVQGHPSTLYALAVHLRKRAIQANGLVKIFESTGETLDGKKRRTIQETFDCVIFDRYGNTEFGVVAHEKASQPDLLWVLDFMVLPEMYRLDSGVTEIVLTGLTNDAMPLIRYRTGDIGAVEQNDEGFYISSLQGRVHDLIPLNGRLYPTHYIQDLLDRLEGVNDFQFELRRGEKPLLRLVVLNEQERSSVGSQVLKWLENSVELEFTDFAGLKRVGWQDKFRYLVSTTSE